MTNGKRKYTGGLIGIGRMRLFMATRIAAQGHPLHAHAISAATIKEFSSRVADARAAKTPAESGRSWAAPRTTPRYSAHSTGRSP
jgi:6-phosphogluconate dehydrogenase (decarboxylating)